MKIALDIMGGDNSPLSNILGSKLFLDDNADISTKIIFVGNKILIEEQIKKNNITLDYKRIDFLDTDEVVSMDEEKPAQTFKNKPNSSLVKAVKLVKDNEADAVISAGNTAALLSSALFILGKIDGIKRPALSTYIPTMQNGFVLCDVGANTDIKPIHLLQFSIMASEYAKHIKNINLPKVGLLNIGEEKNKGNQLTSTAYEVLEKNINGFIGNIEPRYIFDNKADVVVCDGFTGNVIIKLIEGLISHTKNWFSDIYVVPKGEDNTKNSMLEIFRHYNYEEHGGSPFLGVKGIVLKAHGASAEMSIKNSLCSAQILHENNIINKIEQDLVNNKNLTLSSEDLSYSK